MNFKPGHYYVENFTHMIMIFEEERDGLFWFYCPEENRSVFYYDYQLYIIGEY